ncbi:hypothetical protein L2E82_35801 [Cichorium intybus]|uniref:Uncharacterized protein n=1 Tax=Cichorium intybus TaxID=13427 RepID=A0ACB9BPR8_CICIN|nr:hypothetical protein L2E82_35801 [Cichorium intybus]
MAVVSLPTTTASISRPQRLPQTAHSSSPLHLPKPPISIASVRTPLSLSNLTKTPQPHPSKITRDYCNLLNLSVEHGDIELAMAVHASILKIQENSPFLFNALILAYFKLGLTSQAYKVFNRLGNPDVVTFTSMMSWFAKSNREIEAVKVFFEMRRLGIQPNEYSFVAILTACARVLDLELGSQAHSLAIKLGFLEDIYVSNALMGFYSKCGCLDSVLQVFDEMLQRDISSWNTVISALVKESMYEKAFELFHDMLQMDGLKIDHFTLSTLLTACTEHVAIMEGRKLHAQALKLGLENNLSVCNALIGFYTKCRSIKDAIILFDKMPVKDIRTWTQMISAYMNSGLLENAQEVFDKMPEKNCVSYNTLLSGFCQNGLSSNALNMFCKMIKQGLEIDDFTLSNIINACGLHADKNTSEQIHGFVLKSGFKSNNHVESALLDMCTKCGRMTDAEEMFQIHNDSLNKENSSIIWTSMICGYARNGHPYEAISLFFKSQSENTITIDEIVSTTVLSVCATLGFDKIGEQIHSSVIKLSLINDTGVGNALIGIRDFISLSPENWNSQRPDLRLFLSPESLKGVLKYLHLVQ